MLDVNQSLIAQLADLRRRIDRLEQELQAEQRQSARDAIKRHIDRLNDMAGRLDGYMRGRDDTNRGRP